MKKRIYLCLMAMGFACMAITIIIYSLLVWHSTQVQAEAELHNTTNIIMTGMKEMPDPLAYLEKTGQEERGVFRITWIASDGTVQYESDAHADDMENHLNRPEVQQAIRTGSGRAIRDSRTMSKTLYYQAQRLKDGSILRVSMERDSVYAHFLSLLPLILVLLGLTALGCIGASKTLTTSLLAPLRRTAVIMESIGSPEDIRGKVPPVYSELRPLVQKILSQSVVIDQTIQTLEKQRNVVGMMLENLQEGVILTDTAYKILVINQRALSVLSLRRDLAVTGLSLPSLFPEADWDAVRSYGLSEIPRAQRLEKEETLYQMTVQPVYKNHEVYGILFILDDITEREKREQLRREFTSNVSHELKTPLTSIRGFSEVLAAGMFRSKDDVQHFGERIHEQADRLLGMIEEIIHLSHIEERHKTQPWQAVNLQAIVEDVVSFMEPVLEKKQVRIHCTLESASVFGEAVRLREVVMNLIDNAVKYNRPGGHVYVTVKKEGKQVVFSVRDTGIGIPEDKQKRVFERFYRVDASRSKQIEGSGLGLSIVKHIVEQHQGRIILKSKEWEGTLITVCFPVYENTGKTAASTEAEEGVPGAAAKGMEKV